jgi:hypothetical protein
MENEKCMMVECDNDAEFVRIDNSERLLCSSCIIRRAKREGVVSIRAFTLINKENKEKYKEILGNQLYNWIIK